MSHVERHVFVRREKPKDPTPKTFIFRKNPDKRVKILFEMKAKKNVFFFYMEEMSVEDCLYLCIHYTIHMLKGIVVICVSLKRNYG